LVDLTKLRAAIVLLIATAWPSGSADAQCTIKTAGDGVIRVCRNWNFLGHKCRNYDDIKLPSTITEGDVFRVRYGSNPKGYEFQVGRIETTGGFCSIYPPKSGDFPLDSISVPCQGACR
jgi:hypothetical protein